MNYLLDAETVNYLLKRVEPVTRRFETAAATGADFYLSRIVDYQITRYLKLKNAARLQRFYSELTAPWLAVDLVVDDWAYAADLWAARHRAGRPIEDADLLIAVAALKVGAVLVTNNTRHFQNLGLTVENWTP
jgi:tRNA(fMet)-specific endonuclease VapC